MKKRLTLNYVWAECIKMYTYVVKQKAAGDGRDVSSLKQMWLNRRGYKTNELCSDCFFCEYDERHKKPNINCKLCPAAIVDPDFFCGNRPYTWSKYPNLFLRELLRLDKKRRTK